MRKTMLVLMAAGWLVTATTAQAQEKRGPTGLLPLLKNALQNDGNGEVLPPPRQSNNAVVIDNGILPAEGEGGCHDCTSPACGGTCHRKSCLRSILDWLTYHPHRTPRHCDHCQPDAPHPPLYTYFLDRAYYRSGHCP